MTPIIHRQIGPGGSNYRAAHSHLVTAGVRMET